MPRMLVAYASSHGHTRRIAGRIAEVAQAEGFEVDTSDLLAGEDPDVTDYDVVVAGGSIHGGSHQSELAQWVQHHSRTLTHARSAFFSVCLAVAEDTDESRQAAADWIEDLLLDTGWRPRLMTTFAGCLQYREYDVWTRLVMRLLMARGGHTTDIEHDHDYTDWDAVADFARECAALAGRPVRS